MSAYFNGAPVTSSNSQEKTYTITNNRNVGVYDIATANGDCLVCIQDIFSDTPAGAGFVSVSIATNDTTPYPILTAGEGALVNWTTSTHLAFAKKGVWFLMKAGQKLQQSVNGTNGTAGSMKIAVEFFGPLT